MNSSNDSLKDWENILNEFRFLFRNEKWLIETGRLTESEFLEKFFDLVLDTCEAYFERNES